MKMMDAAKKWPAQGIVGYLTKHCRCMKCKCSFVVNGAREQPLFGTVLCPTCMREQFGTTTKQEPEPKPYKIDGTLTDFPR